MLKYIVVLKSVIDSRIIGMYGVVTVVKGVHFIITWQTARCQMNKLTEWKVGSQVEGVLNLKESSMKYNEEGLSPVWPVECHTQCAKSLLSRGNGNCIVVASDKVSAWMQLEAGPPEGILGDQITCFWHVGILMNSEESQKVVHTASLKDWFAKACACWESRCWC